MSRTIRLVGLAGGLVLAGVLVGARGQSMSAAPRPGEMTTARRVFVSNAGVDSGLFPHPFSGGSDRAYNEFYAEMRSWGRFELVDDPASADLVLELRLVAPAGPKDPDKTKGASDPLPMFRVVVFDRATHYALWAVTESVEAANLQATHDRNFDKAVNGLIEDLKRVIPPQGMKNP